MNYYSHHIGDYARDTAHLTMLEDGAYRRLLDLEYATERPLPLDPRMLYRLVRAISKHDRAAVDTVLAEFFDKGPDGWTQKRCIEEINRARDKSLKAKDSAGKRWQPNRNANASPLNANASEINANAYANASDSNANAPPNALPTQCEGNAPNNQEVPPLPPQPDSDAKAGRKRDRPPRHPASLAPASFEVDESMWSWAEALGVTAEAIPTETDKFLDHHRAKGNRFSDWRAAWQNWMRKHLEFRRAA